MIGIYNTIHINSKQHVSDDFPSLFYEMASAFLDSRELRGDTPGAIAFSSVPRDDVVYDGLNVAGFRASSSAA